jgi:hypothetical protein
MSSKKPKNVHPTEPAAIAMEVAPAPGIGNVTIGVFSERMSYPGSAPMKRSGTTSAVWSNQNSAGWCVALVIARMITELIFSLHRDYNTGLDLTNFDAELLIKFYTDRQVCESFATEAITLHGIHEFLYELAPPFYVAPFKYIHGGINTGVYDVPRSLPLSTGEFDQGKTPNYSANIDINKSVIDRNGMTRIAEILNATRFLLRTNNKTLQIDITNFVKNDHDNNLLKLNSLKGTPLMLTFRSMGVKQGGVSIQSIPNTPSNFDVLAESKTGPITFTQKRDADIVKYIDKYNKKHPGPPMEQNVDLHSIYATVSDESTGNVILDLTNSWHGVQTMVSKSGQQYFGVKMKVLPENLGRHIPDAMRVLVVDRPDPRPDPRPDIKRKASGITKRKNKNNRTKSANKSKSKSKSKPKKSKTKKNN